MLFKSDCACRRYSKHVRRNKKSLAEFFARRQKIVLIVFSGGMYVGENTSHGASVELFAYGEQPRHRAQCSLFVKEPQ